MKFLLALLAVLAVACIIAGQVCEQAKAPCDCGKAQPTPIKCQGGQTCDPTGGNTNDGACTDPANSGGSGIPPAPQALLRCQNKDGAFLPSATICADKLDSKICENIFVGGASSGSSGTEPACAGGAVSAPCKCGSAPTPCQKGEDCDKSASKCNPGGGRKKRQTSGGDKRPEKCDLPELTDLARQCAKTCKICCETVEHGCEDNPAFNVDCQNVKFNCQVPQLASTMAIACPRTCGLCGTGVCKDTGPGCDSMKGLCRDITLRSYLGQNCARTCNLCDPTGGGLAAPCENTGIDCDRYAREGWCQGVPEHRNSMQTWCRKSCGWC
ncbi:Protein F35E8.7 [Aphelenchoides avenae]|nr:Protein F35E8.7 [Aphelenchus avenae]